MKKLIQVFILFLVCMISSLHAFADDSQDNTKQEVETRQEKILTVFKRHKKKIEVAIAAILISHFFGKPPSPLEPQPLIINDYGLNKNKFRQFTQNNTYYIKMGFYRIRLMYRNMHILLYLIGNHPLALLEVLKNGQGIVNIEEIVYGTVRL